MTMLFLAAVVAALIVGYLIGWRDASRSERRRMLLDISRREVSE